MPNPFVWFDLRAPRRDAAARFYGALLDWDVGDDGALSAGGDPWGVVADEPGAETGYWLPYIQVDDVDEAARKAVGLGAEIVQEKTAGPAGFFTTIADPTGARVALWEPPSS
jgi:predicted enzyme related to lactoylglutathione lyase